MITYPGRLRRLARHRQMDPARDYYPIFRSVVREEFELDMQIAIVLAFWRAFAVPEIAKVFVGTGETINHIGKRVDDTAIIMYEIFDHGFNHERARLAIRRMNQLHRTVTIPNEDMLYALGALVFIPVRWINQHGWRPLDPHEQEAIFHFYRQLGRRMAIRGIPDSYQTWEAWFDDYERRRFIPSDDGATAIRATKRILEKFPPPVRAIGAPLFDALFDPPVRAATRLPEPSRLTSAVLSTALTTRARIQRLLPPCPDFVREGLVDTDTYPHGYDLAAIGPASQPPLPAAGSSKP